MQHLATGGKKKLYLVKTEHKVMFTEDVTVNARHLLANALIIIAFGHCYNTLYILGNKVYSHSFREIDERFDTGLVPVQLGSVSRLEKRENYSNWHGSVCNKVYTPAPLVTKQYIVFFLRGLCIGLNYLALKVLVTGKLTKIISIHFAKDSEPQIQFMIALHLRERSKLVNYRC